MKTQQPSQPSIVHLIYTPGVLKRNMSRAIGESPDAIVLQLTSEGRCPSDVIPFIQQATEKKIPVFVYAGMEPVDTSDVGRRSPMKNLLFGVHTYLGRDYATPTPDALENVEKVIRAGAVFLEKPTSDQRHVKEVLEELNRILLRTRDFHRIRRILWKRFRVNLARFFRRQVELQIQKGNNLIEALRPAWSDAVVYQKMVSRLQHAHVFRKVITSRR